MTCYYQLSYSEDESLITPPVSTKNRLCRHVSFNKAETNINMGRQQLKEKTASAEEEERAALKENISTGSGPRMLETNVVLKDDKLPVTAPSVITDAFEMDSDTDLDGEEEGVASAVPVTLTTSQKVDPTPDKAQFYMDSDTDFEDDNNASGTVPESAAPPENTKPLLATAVFQPEDITMDSDTDVDDDDVLDAASKAKSMSGQSKTTADSAPTTYLKHFNLDSDTESEEEDLKRVQINSSFKVNETPTALAEGVSAAPPRPDSETYEETVPAPAISKFGDAESCPAADAHADLDIQSDSDTDVEHDSPLVKQTFVGTNMSLTHSTVSKAIQSDSDADTDVEESSTAPILGRVTTASLDKEGEKDVEHEVALAAPEEGQVPHLVRENTPGLLNPTHQYCSTPVQLPGKYSTSLNIT